MYNEYDLTLVKLTCQPHTSEILLSDEAERSREPRRRQALVNNMACCKPRVSRGNNYTEIKERDVQKSLCPASRDKSGSLRSSHSRDAKRDRSREELTSCDHEIFSKADSQIQLHMIETEAMSPWTDNHHDC